MKTIEKLEQASIKDESLKQQGINSTFFYAYKRTLDTVNENINFNNVIWDYDVKEILNHCREFGLECITISNSQAGIEDILSLFENEGCKIELTKVRTSFIDYKTNEPEIRNAFKVIISK